MMRLIFVVAIVCFLALTAVCKADNMIERVLRQVLPITLTNEVDPTPSTQHQTYSNQNQQHHVTEDDNSNTAGWNPFTWFTPNLRTIPYNPDTDLATVNSNNKSVYSKSQIIDIHKLLLDSQQLYYKNIYFVPLPCQSISCTYIQMYSDLPGANKRKIKVHVLHYLYTFSFITQRNCRA